jgi:hypothetical protein
VTVAAPDVVTTGELGRRFDRFEDTVTKGIAGLSDKLDTRPDWKDVQNLLTPLEARVASLEGWQTWALRLGGPAIVGALVGVAVNSVRIAG